jgi:choloylglycine hydrolase
MMPRSRKQRHRYLPLALAILIILAGCRTADEAPIATQLSSVTTALTKTPEPAGRIAEPDASFGLSTGEIESLNSLRKVDEYPLYTMHYTGSYNTPITEFDSRQMIDPSDNSRREPAPGWACSLFAAFGDSAGMLYGRNFDWRFSPALLLFTDPEDGYASVSMVDIEYLGFGGDLSGKVDDLPLSERRRLLDAPLLPFDGMNEQGLVIGMAAVPPGDMRPDPDKEVIGSLGVIREILDHAGDTNEAVEIMARYNIDMGGGPPLHYLIADTTGRGLLVEFYQGEMKVIINQSPWHRATNFLKSAYEDPAEGVCWRNNELGRRLEETGGVLSTGEAMDLLRSVSQTNTQWSIVYGMNGGDVLVAMGRDYDNRHAFEFEMGDRQPNSE